MYVLAVLYDDPPSWSSDLRSNTLLCQITSDIIYQLFLKHNPVLSFEADFRIATDNCLLHSLRR